MSDADGSAGRRGRTVLVVDDDADMRLLLTTLLETKGFSVVGESPDGAEAVLESFEDQPDFVILDYMMPNVDGREAARFIRATCPRAYIVAFSGAGLDEAGWVDWADNYLDKSDIITLPDLLEAAVEERA